ncbi:MAG: hypothetical protein LQ338_003923, partial [Usnochroma carphineum]
MFNTQPDQDAECQAFLKWIRSARRSGTVTGYGFIPVSAVKDYLGANQRVESLLTSLFGKDFAKTVDAETVRKHYLRPLAILLWIGQGDMIRHFVRYQSLKDHQLPFRTCPEDFPISPQDPNFFRRFFNEQWQFCATDLEYNMDLHLHKEEILPILHKQEIGRGGNAIVSKIVVDEEYNRLVPQHWKIPERPRDLLNTFVLKTYRGADAKDQHKAERDAFINLRYDNKPSPNIIAYYGSFVDDDTYNIILEYADGGTFEDFMATRSKPPSEEAMLGFWNRLCSITHGLATIHGNPGPEPSGTPVLLGWHQDIKPANILVFSGSGTSSYDVYFKIADLSLCHFKKIESLQREASDLDAFGTRAYGRATEFPPLYDKGLLVAQAPLKPLGWIIHQRRSPYKGEHIFHDGHGVLPIVQETHEQIAKRQQRADRVTVEILQVVNSGMLLDADRQRYSARQALDHFKRAIDSTRQKLDLFTRSESEKDHASLSRRGWEERPITPPSVPPGYAGGSKASSGSPASPPFSVLAPARPIPIDIIESFSPGTYSATASRSRHSTATNGNPRDKQNQTSFGSFSSDSIDLHDLPSPPQPADSYRSSSVDRFDAFASEAQGDNPCGRPGQGPHRGTVIGGVSGRSGSLGSDKAPIRRSQTEKKPSNHPHHFSVGSEHGRSTESTPAIPDTNLPANTISPSHANSSGVSAGHGDQSLPSVAQRSYLLLQDAFTWKERKKKGFRDPLHGEENMKHVNGRDHIFVVDNTESMERHRDNVIKVVSVLSYLLKTSDKNGLDLYFTQSTKKVNSGRSTKLAEAVNQVPFLGTSSMRHCLSNIFDEHKNRFGSTTGNSSGGWLSRLNSSETRKPLSFYILTDGIWQPRTPVRPVIVNLARSMLDHQLLEEHVGIQFIRFGEDPRGIACLDELDHSLDLGAME